MADAVTGLVYAEAGDCVVLGDLIELADLTTLVAERLCEAGAGGELESVIVTSARHHHITSVVPRRGDDFLLTTVVDRRTTNLALAMRASEQQVADVLG